MSRVNLISLKKFDSATAQPGMYYIVAGRYGQRYEPDIWGGENHIVIKYPNDKVVTYSIMSRPMEMERVFIQDNVLHFIIAGTRHDVAIDTIHSINLVDKQVNMSNYPWGPGFNEC